MIASIIQGIHRASTARSTAAPGTSQCFAVMLLVALLTTQLCFGSKTRDFMLLGVKDIVTPLNWIKRYHRRWTGGPQATSEDIAQYERKAGRTTVEGQFIHTFYDQKGRYPRLNKNKMPDGRAISRNHRLSDSSIAHLMIHMHARIRQEREKTGKQKQEGREEKMMNGVDRLLRALAGYNQLSEDHDRETKKYSEASTAFKKSLEGNNETHRLHLNNAIRKAAEGPANLRFGDSRTNSRIGPHFDPNHKNGYLTPDSDNIASAVEGLSKNESGTVADKRLTHEILRVYTHRETQQILSSSIAVAFKNYDPNGKGEGKGKRKRMTDTQIEDVAGRTGRKRRDFQN